MHIINNNNNNSSSSNSSSGQSSVSNAHISNTNALQSLSPLVKTGSGQNNNNNLPLPPSTPGPDIFNHSMIFGSSGFPPLNVGTTNKMLLRAA